MIHDNTLRPAHIRFRFISAPSVRGTLWPRVWRIGVRQRKVTRVEAGRASTPALSSGQLLSFEHPLDTAAIIYCSQCACLVLEEQPALSGDSFKRAE